MGVYLYTHVFPLHMNDTISNTPIHLWMEPGESREIPDVRRPYPTPHGVEVAVIPADTVADIILQQWGHIGLVKLKGPKPTAAEIAESESKALSFSIAVLREYSARCKHAEVSGLPSPLPPHYAVLAAKYLIKKGVNVSDLGLPASFVEVVAGMSHLLPASQRKSYHWEESSPASVPGRRGRASASRGEVGESEGEEFSDL